MMTRFVGMMTLIWLAIGSVTYCDGLEAWSFEGHRAITSAALDLVEPSLPLDREYREWALEGSVFPDLTRPSSLSMLSARESPKHYVNLEWLRGRDLPPDRAAYARMWATLSREQETRRGGDELLESYGVLPYVVVESTQLLATVFRQVRSAPDDRRLHLLALHYAGALTHFTADLCQPLHTSIHHDGRVGDEGRSPQSGLHDLVDRLLDRVPNSAPVTRSSSGAPEAQIDLFEVVVAEMKQSHAEVDHIYRLESEMKELHDTGRVTPGVQAFVDERFAAAVRFTARMLELAWQLSASVELP